MLADGRELTDLHGEGLVLLVDDLVAGHVLTGRGVDDDGVDLTALQRGDRGIESVVHAGGLGRLDVVVDVGQTRRADLVTVLVGLKVGRAVVGHDAAALQRDNRLVHVVVAGREVDGLRPVGGVGDLVDVEVELLGSGRVARVEGLGHPVDILRRHAELLREGVHKGRLVALLVGGLVVDEPGFVDGAVGPDGELAWGVGLGGHGLGAVGQLLG